MKRYYFSLVPISLFLLLSSLSAYAQKGHPLIFSEKYRPQYHFSYPKGWMNDPTGLIYFNGNYQMNFHNATSKDLLHWKFYIKHKLANDSLRPMSGSVVIDWNNTSGFGTKNNPAEVAIYSVLRKRDNMQMQCISYSNDGGNTFHFYKGNPVININSTEFRDPQVFWYKPKHEWIMVVALSAECKVRFYSSKNLKKWKFLSDFGPEGARNGVWECPDFFPLPVNGSKNNIKWVLKVDVQPVGGQYFIGSFNGNKFVLDSSFVKQLVYNRYIPAGKLLFDFESNLKGWKETGNAFLKSPCSGALPKQSAVMGKIGKQFIDSFYKGDASTGTLLSPSFIINNNYLNFLIGGGDHPGKTCVNLIFEGKKVREATGLNTETLKWTGWNVSRFKGKTARIEIVDSAIGGFGHILTDQFMLCDNPAKHQRERAFWIDYGPDFYAARSWRNIPDGSSHRIWIAWMSNWLYANNVPTSPWKGFQSFPRKVTLKTFPKGIRLIQQPIKEIKTLRGKHFSVTDLTADKNSTLNIFRPDGNCYELKAELEFSGGSDAGLNLCVGKNQKTIVGFNSKNCELYVDRRKSGDVSFSPSFPQIDSCHLDMHNNKIFLHILVDHSSVEVFANKGEKVISSLIFPDSKSDGIQLFSKNGTLKVNRLDIWELKSVWKTMTK